jgi:uncharacterized protein
MLQKLRELVRKEASEDDWHYHVILVVKYARQLAENHGADPELTEMAALLHDIGRFRHGGKGHEVTGMAEAEKILKDLNAPHDVIDEVKHCIRTHRGKEAHPETKIAEIIRDADALSQYDVVPRLIKAGLEHYGGDVKETVEWLDAKFDRNWNRKLLLPGSKEMVKDKHAAAKLLLNAYKE